MSRHAIARHARKASFLAASCCALLTCTAIMALLVSNQWQTMQTNQQAAVELVVSIRTAVTDAMRLMKKEYQADCTESSLTALRLLQFHTPQIGDFGVINADGRLICSTVVGVLASPMDLPRPDTIMAGLPGEEIGVSFQTTARAIGSAGPSAVIRLDPFDAVVSPNAMGELLHTGVSAVQLANPRGGIFTAAQDPAVSAGWTQRLQSAAYTSADLQTFSWTEGAFIAVQRVPHTYYFVQSVVPVEAFLQSHQRLLWGGVGLALLIALLVYQALLPIFIRWLKLEYRIGKLLNDKNVVCVYQPIIDLATQRPIGCEVLMRLHVGKETIAPDEAIPAIIARGLTWQLDQLVVQKAVAELAQHLPQLRDFKVAFNFFPANVTNAKIERLFAEVLRQTPHSGLHFDIEVLEQAYGDGIVEEIAKLRKNHFLFSVDDFGTGYSNLGNIKAISPDFLKIDRSFVRDMEDASLRSSLIPEIMGIARAVGAEVIAEGIENAQQRDMLHGLGVEFGQGYYFARPQAIEGLVQYLAAV